MSQLRESSVSVHADQCAVYSSRHHRKLTIGDRWWQRRQILSPHQNAAEQLIVKSRKLHRRKPSSALVHASCLVYVLPAQFHHKSKHYKRSLLPSYPTTIYLFKRQDYQNWSVLYCVLKLCTVISTLRWAVLMVLWIGFCHTGTISLCIDLFVFIFVYFVFFCQLHNAYVLYGCSTVGWTWWDWSLILRNLSSFSVLTLFVGPFYP